jgi:5S rRNA maturation endonuclease (ribonuclease M5)/KaiC/GvpD/RAD55 family RecA-like ATPase
MEVSHNPCPFCKSSDAFSYNDETGLFYCFSCSANSGNKRGLVFDGKTLQPFTPKAIEEGIYLEPYIPDNYRGISKQVMEKHGVYFTKMGDKETVHYTYPNGTKHRELPKQIKISGKVDKFYGQDDYTSGKSITITEGEEDRLSVIEMMGDWPAVSVPGATPSKDFWENARQYLQNFEKIVLSVDSDEPGDKLADKFYRMFPGKVYRVNHGKYKDANDFLKADAETEYKRSWWNANKLKPDYFVSSADQWEKILLEETPYQYVPTPVEALNKKIKGFVKGGITVIKALPGTGKTSAFRYFQHHLLKNSEVKIAVLHMEEMKSTTGRGLVTYELGVNVNTKEEAEWNDISEQKVVETIRELTKDERFVTFAIDTSNPIEDTLSKIRVAREVYNVDFIFLDHLQRLAYLEGVETATSALTALAVKIVDMTRDDPFGVIAISHVNEDGATKYAKAVEEEAIVVVEMSRDKKAEDPDERDTTYLDVTKNRPFALTGFAGCLEYDHDSTMVREKIKHEPQTQVQTNREIPF